MFVALLLLFAGTWEGELKTAHGPVFMTLRLTDKPSIAVLGRTIPIEDATETGDRIRIVAHAITLDGQLIDGRLTGTLKEDTDALPFAFDRVPDYPPPKDREERWSQDLDALATRFLKYDRSFSPGARLRFLEAIDAIRKHLEEASDAEVIMKMASAVALANNAHTRLYLLRNRTELRRLPVRVWWFRDGLRVVRTTPEYRQLLGCRVDDVAGMDVRQVRDIVAPAFAGNPPWRDYMSVYSMTSPEALYGLGITPSLASVDFGVSDCAAARVSIKPLPLLRKDKPTEAWWDLTPQYGDPDHRWTHVLNGPLPLYLRNPSRYYWFEFVASSGILYFHYSRAAEMSDEPMKQFSERLLAATVRPDVKAFVLDVRFNTGGNDAIAADLMKQLQERTASIPRFIITGRATFSAGISAAASWRLAPNATFVGEGTGDELDFWSEGGNIVLPNSGLYAHFGNVAHSLSPAPCPTTDYCNDMSIPSLRPDIAVSSTWNEYRTGVDVAMNAVSERLKRSSASP